MTSLHIFTSSDTGDEARKLGVLGIILVVSLFAVSFPGLSKRTPFLRIPGLVFFIGKHFGTGVILSTAFIHLLGDAYSSLQKEEVTKRYGPVGKWTGCIILCSLLAIFLVEYISTLYVEHLHDQPSAPSTPVVSREGSVTPQERLPVVNINENTPLLVTATDEHRCPHHAVLPAKAFNGVPIELLTSSPRVCRLSIAHMSSHSKLSSYSGHHHHHQHQHEATPTEAPEAEASQPKVGRKRQVIGILVLQLGIMIHSLVIGMTLVVTSGSDFTSLTTAIIFHQLFEGLSLGIRIAALPPAKHTHDSDTLVGSDSDSDDAGALPPSLSPRGSSAHKRHANSTNLRQRISRLSARLRHIQWLKPTMAILFGLTTPAGMGLGMLIWGAGGTTSRDDSAAMQLVQGIMSAVSAGLLVYAATVEMLAGDFVYGDVDGGHQHHHHGHAHEEEEEDEHGHGHAHGAEEDGHGSGHGQSKPAKASLRKRLLALGSLFAGVVMMILVGLGE